MAKTKLKDFSWYNKRFLRTCGNAMNDIKRLKICTLQYLFISRKIRPDFFINWFTTKLTWILRKYNKNKIEILF